MCEGAAIRLGGHEVDGVVYGTYNHVRDVPAVVGYPEHVLFLRYRVEPTNDMDD